MKSRDVTHKKEGHLKGRSVEEIFRAHHNLDDKMKPIHGVDHIDKGCQCDDCLAYLSKNKAQVQE